MTGTIPRADRDFTIRDYIPGQPIPSLIRDPKTGIIVVNELKKYVKPFTMVTEPEEVVLGPYELSLPIPMLMDSSGHFEIIDAFFSYTQLEKFTVMLFDPNSRPILMNREIHITTIASGGGVATHEGIFFANTSAGRPFRWPCSFWMNVREGGGCIFAQFRNLSPNENRIRFALHGLRWYHTQAPYEVNARMKSIYRDRQRVMPYFYTTETHVQLAEGASGEYDIRFTDEALVECVKLSRYSTGRFNCRIREKGSGKRYMSDPIRDDLVFGEGEYPFLLWESNLYRQNMKLTFELENLYDGTNDIWITVSARKILTDPRDDRLARPTEAGGVEI